VFNRIEAAIIEIDEAGAIPAEAYELTPDQRFLVYDPLGAVSDDGMGLIVQQDVRPQDIHQIKFQR
jgi:hypothetical protein